MEEIHHLLKKVYDNTIDEKARSYFSSKVMLGIQKELLHFSYQEKEAKNHFKLKIALVSFTVFLFGFLFHFFYSDWKNSSVNKLVEKEISYYSPLPKEVLIMGDFTDWRKEKMIFDNGKWSYKSKVYPNTLYKYVFIVDGVVTQDPSDGPIEYKGYFGNNHSVLMVFNEQNNN